MDKKNIDWSNLGFAYVKTDWRYVSMYRNGAWDEGTLTDENTVTINESAGVLQYAQTCFEGLKAYTTADGKIVCFRPDLNADRMIDTCARLKMPAFPKERFLDAVRKTVEANRETRSMKFIDQSVDIINKGQLMQIYPEGRNTPDGKIHACAPWDFDYALGISWADQTNAEAKDKIENPTRYSVDSHYMIKQMLKFETFRYAVLEVYSRQSTQKAINEFKTNIELFAEQNRASANMNFVGSTYRVKNFPYEYDEALEYIRSIIHARVEWFDNKMKNFS